MTIPAPTPTDTVTATAPDHAPPELSLTRLYLMRGGFALMFVGLVVKKWPLLADIQTMPLFEGVTLALLVAMSLLALLGLRHPVKLLPVLLFETTWKLLWLSLVALPTAMNGDMSPDMSQVAVNCSLVVLIIVAIPWRYVWTQYVRASGDRWRR